MWRQNVSTSVHIGLSLLTAAVVKCCFCYCVYVEIKYFFILFLLFYHALLTVVQVQGMC